jgi:hypothetical protein
VRDQEEPMLAFTRYRSRLAVLVVVFALLLPVLPTGVTA